MAKKDEKRSRRREELDLDGNLIRVYRDTDAEVKDRLRELREEDQGHPSLVSFFVYGGYKVGSSILIVIFFLVLAWSMAVAGFDALKSIAEQALDVLDPPPVQQTPSHSPNGGEMPAEQGR